MGDTPSSDLIGMYCVHMDQRQILTVMESVQLGYDAAENEPDLQQVFVTDTATYRKLVSDEVDVIIGGKGSGKSAMYRMITETELHAELDVIPAVNPTGSPVFRRLFRDNSSEARLITIWTAYATSLIANFVVDTFYHATPGKYLVEEIDSTLVGLGLRKGADEKPSLLDRIRNARGMKVGASVAGTGASLEFDLGEGEASSIAVQPADFLDLLQKCGEVLELHGRRVWIAFDRLDECFDRNTAIEGRALRGLLRTALNMHQALGYVGTVRLKIFLRSDLMTRMTRDETFTNSTHLRKDVLRWNTNGIAHIVAKRVLRSEEFKRNYVDPGHDDPTLAVWTALLPTLKCKYHARYPTATILCQRTADGGEFSPRNIISLLTFALARARDNQRRALDVGRAGRSETPLIQEGELQSAQGDVSRQRLQDTVLNEFPRVSKYVGRLSNGVNSYGSTAQLANSLGLEADQSRPSMDEVIQELLLSGVLAARGSSYEVPLLYRAALKTKADVAKVKPS